jgi:predicted metal-dependent peptidase
VLMMNNLSPDQRVQKAVIDIMANPRYVALAGVLMIGSRRVETDKSKCPTAYTNGRDEVYGADFIADLNDRQLRFLVLHEVYHKLYRHLTTWQHLYKENAQLANMACDYVINCKLVDDNADLFATMDGPLAVGCHDTKYRGWDSAQVFNDLKKNPPPQGQGGGQGQGQGGSGQGQGGQGFDEHGWGDAEEMTAEEQRDLAREIDEAIRQGALAAGKLGNGMDRDMVELLQPQVDWREVLRDFVQTTCQGNDYSTWRRPNRRYIGAGVYMPSGISEQIGEIVVAIDTSGSIGARELGVFLAEIKSVADTVHPEAIRILYWDTSVCGDERYEGAEVDNIIQSTKPKGGGGTDVRCVPQYITDKQIKAQAVIVLTDGYLFGGWGQWHHPVLWCVLDNERAVPDVGKTVHVKARDL